MKVRVRDVVFAGAAGTAVGAIGVGIARDTKLYRQMSWLRTQYHQARAELHPMLKGNTSQNIGTDVFRALQSAYRRGVADGQSGVTTEDVVGPSRAAARMFRKPVYGSGRSYTAPEMLRPTQDGSPLPEWDLPEWDLTPPKG